MEGSGTVKASPLGSSSPEAKTVPTPDALNSSMVSGMAVRRAGVICEDEVRIASVADSGRREASR